MATAARRSLLDFHAPRILYGLEEVFILFPFDRGSRRSRLVMRASALEQLCNGPRPPLPYAKEVGFPLVLGELLNVGFHIAAGPHVLTGRQINSQYRQSEWALRWYRVYSFTPNSMRFEAGPKISYGTMTSFYQIEQLLELAHEGLHANRRSGLSLRK